MSAGGLPRSWRASVDAILRGDRPRQPFVTLGRTPDLLVSLGLLPVNLVMTVGKIARCRREHPEVALETWHTLPGLIAEPLAVFPSERQDRSLVVVLIATDRRGDPVVVPVLPDAGTRQNVVLSVYGKEAGFGWVQRQVQASLLTGSPLFTGKGFAATLPQPGFTEVIPSSPGPIPADGATKPARPILSIPPKVKDSGE